MSNRWGTFRPYVTRIDNFEIKITINWINSPFLPCFYRNFDKLVLFYLDFDIIKVIQGINCSFIKLLVDKLQ